MRRIFCWVVPVLSMLWLTGCGQVQSRHPLSDQRDAKPDPRLVGAWKPKPDPKTREDGKEDYTLLLSYDEHGLGHLREIRVNERKERAERTGVFFVTRTGKASYLNVLPDKRRKGPWEPGVASEGRGMARWEFSRYGVNGDGSLTLYAPATAPFAQGIKAGRLAGSVRHPGQLDETVRLRSSSRVLLAFVEAESPDTVFPAPMVFVRSDKPARGWWGRLFGRGRFRNN